MIKQHKKLIVLTAIITLLPIIMGLLLWNKLPDTMATHFGMNNQANGYSSKAFAVFGLPLIILAIHFVCIIATSIDPKSKDINRKIFSLVLWICPFISILVCSIIYGYALGYLTNITFLMTVMVGILFIALGNFMPTVKQNYSIGFRISWALNDSENWYHTHRFGGKCMVVCGILILLAAPFLNLWGFVVLAVTPGVLPIIYSYLYDRKKNA